MSGPNTLLIMTDEERKCPALRARGTEGIPEGAIECSGVDSGRCVGVQPPLRGFSGLFAEPAGAVHFERMDQWNAVHDITMMPFAGPPADAELELHNLTADPEERINHVVDDKDTVSKMQSVLSAQREAKRLLASRRNPV
jgi:hypothetical protein